VYQEKEEYIDLRTDPLFGALSTNSIQKLEKQIKKENLIKSKEYTVNNDQPGVKKISPFAG